LGEVGRKFDQELDDVVLGGGALPLEILDEQIDAWIKTRR